MKVLTITQPWATLVAIGAKQIETRSWRTDYRGPLAIHASKRWKSEARAFLRESVTRHLNCSLEIPLGEILCTCVLAGCVPTANLGRYLQQPEVKKYLQSQGFTWSVPLGQELAFGDYADRRWAWLLADVKRVTPAIPATGHLGLWETRLI